MFERSKSKKKSEIKDLPVPVVTHNPTGLFSATAKQQIHVILTQIIGNRLRVLKHIFVPSNENHFVWKNHAFGIDSRLEPLFEDEKARPTYLGLVGSYTQAILEGQLTQAPETVIEYRKKRDVTLEIKTIRPLINVEGIAIKYYNFQDTDVFKKAFDDGEAAAVLTAGTKNQQQTVGPDWKFGLAMGIPAGIVLGLIIAPYLTKALTGG